MDLINAATHVAWDLTNSRFISFDVDVANRCKLVVKEAGFVNTFHCVVILLPHMTVVRLLSCILVLEALGSLLGSDLDLCVRRCDRCFAMQSQSYRQEVIFSASTHPANNENLFR